MRLVKIAKGISSAAVRFLVFGIALPYIIEYFSPTLSSYLQLPPPSDVWLAFILIGAMFAVTSFFQNAYSKGDFPWLFGKIGGGIASLVFFTYIFLLLPKTVGSAGIQYTGLLSLIYLAVALTYLYLVLDFVDARRSRTPKPDVANPVVA
jgi:hypothetical protein